MRPLIYGYATGAFSSRKLERVTDASAAFRFIAANQHPDHHTIAKVRRRFPKQTKAAKKLYVLRKQRPEPVLGIIKSVIGFRQFSLRGINKTRGEWSLVTMSWNITRIFALAAAVP